ncbi:MAG TPA: TPM domain-containing protein [Opitutales bacterium]|jgi:uncharacterized membrane protein|nr:TPM domain-containing protein [Opitutales bacterium]
MHHKEFIAQLDDARVLAAIARAELATSGEIRVCVSHKHRADALAAAQKRFRKLGMDRTPLRNAVLIYFAPQARSFAIFGDQGVHEKCGENFWQGIAAKITPQLKKGKYTEAIEEAVRDIGEVLARHFPRLPGDKNNLPDDIVRE